MSTADDSEHAWKNSRAATARVRRCAATARSSPTADCSAATAATHWRSEPDATSRRALSRSGCGSPIWTAASARRGRRKHEAGLAARLAHGRSAVYAIVDRDQLHICTRCDEIVYPPEPERRGTVIYQQAAQPSRCHFCGGSELAGWDPAYQSELEYGPSGRLLGADLTSGGIDGLMDDHDQRKGSPVMRVCLYQRISTDEDHQPTSLKTQRERLERYCEAMEDWRIVAAHEDQASGTSLDRPGLQQALDLAREKRDRPAARLPRRPPHPQGAPARRAVRGTRPARRRA